MNAPEIRWSTEENNRAFNCCLKNVAAVSDVTRKAASREFEATV